MNTKNILLTGVLLTGLAGGAVAAGLYTNLLPGVTAPTVNGAAACTVVNAVGLTGGTNCSSAVPTINQVSPFVNTTQLTSNFQSAPMLIPMDTGLSGGVNPQTVAVTPVQIAMTYASMAGNTATSTVHAATLNTQGGIITTESLSTAAGASYTFTLTDSLITATSVLQVAMYGLTNTGGNITLTSVTAASGSAVIVWTNTGGTAFNGTMTIAFHL
jgi:hypothetical protein